MGLQNQYSLPFGIQQFGQNAPTVEAGPISFIHSSTAESAELELSLGLAGHGDLPLTPLGSGSNKAKNSDRGRSGGFKSILGAHITAIRSREGKTEWAAQKRQKNRKAMIDCHNCEE